MAKEGLDKLSHVNEKGASNSVRKGFVKLQDLTTARLQEYHDYCVSNCIISDKVYFCSFIESHLTKLFTLHYLQKNIIYPFLIFPALPESLRQGGSGNVEGWAGSPVGDELRRSPRHH